MHPAINTSLEWKRGCGYRKPGGLYLVSDPGGRKCGRIPFPLTVCACCGEGFRPSRGFRWVDGDKLLDHADSCKLSARECVGCPASGRGDNIGRSLLIWVSPEHYTVEEFDKETNEVGISRRITGDALPRSLVLGKTWVFLAHRDAIVRFSGMTLEEHPSLDEPEYTPGVFKLFLPTRVEKIVTGEETDYEIEALVERGITPVRVFYEEDKS